MPATVENLAELFRERLSGIYSEQEITGLLRILFRHRMGWSAADLHLGMKNLLGAEGPFFMEALGQLARNKPIQYIIGVTEFRGLELKVTEAALIPRPETEELVDLVIRENIQKQYQRFSVLDIGTGSGCIAISLRKSFLYAEVDAIDASGEALSLAEENAASLNCPVRFFRRDILDPEAGRTLGGYDLVVSNPPYVTESERQRMQRHVLDYEPAAALFVPDEDPLKFYRAIAAFAWEHLVRPGALFLEINERFGRELSRLLADYGYEQVTVHNDLSGKDRFISAYAKSLMKDTSYWMVDKELPDLPEQVSGKHTGL